MGSNITSLVSQRVACLLKFVKWKLKNVRVKNCEPSDEGKDHISMAQSSEDHDNAEIDRNDADISLKAVTLQKQYLVFNLSEPFRSFHFQLEVSFLNAGNGQIPIPMLPA